jgi:hypothetical protein
MKKINILFVSAILLLNCCERSKVEPRLPPITMEGKNTIGFMVNGKVWLPVGIKPISPISASYYENSVWGWHLAFSAINVVLGDSFLFGIQDNPIQIDHEYDLSDPYSTWPVYSQVAFKGGLCWYQYEAEHVVEGRLKILKLNQQIVAGTFEFTSFNPACGDTIKVTEGRFDIAIEY